MFGLFWVFEVFEVRFGAIKWCSEKFDVRSQCSANISEHLKASKMTNFPLNWLIQFWKKIFWNIYIRTSRKLAIYAVLHSSQIVLGSGKKFQIFFYKFWKKLSHKNAIKMATICSVFDLKCSSSISKSEAMFEKFDVRCCWCSTCSMFGILMFDPALIRTFKSVEEEQRF